jgi:hypothetical protein
VRHSGCQRAIDAAGAANDPAFAKRMGIPQDVAREYVAADQAKKKRKR